MIRLLVLVVILGSSSAAFVGASETDSTLWEGAPEDAFSAHNRAIAHWGMGMYETAARDLESISSAYPKVVAFRLNLAMVLLARRHYDESLRELKETEIRTPNSPRVQYLFGRCLTGLNLETEAVQRFELAAVLDPGEPAFPLGASESLSALGRTAEAEKALRRVLVLRPDHGPALYRLARSLESRGQSEEARLLLDRFSALKKRQRTQAERSPYDDPLEPSPLPLPETGGLHWLKVDVVPEREDARAVVTIFSGRRTRRQAVPAGVLRLSLGAVKRVDAIRVDWPDGRHSYRIDVPSGREIVIKEVGAHVW
ncbi:MAG TPA: hypothetical protein DCZ01_05690 [Elusimicrobia bacterium]|nr:MAG: hypothetical protein A2X37_11335 [Elusimicrobia bacterium GWA2_66_18]HAZ08012.1 hypothetical protein [Elusimicrobiota bacterium]